MQVSNAVWNAILARLSELDFETFRIPFWECYVALQYLELQRGMAL